MTDQPKKRPPPRSTLEAEAAALRQQAAAARALANVLHRAIMAADWRPVADVRSELAQIALGYDAIAERLEK